MKKQKFMKLSAFTSDPDLGNSFYAPASHDGEISVVFRGKDISIHGWDGSAWTTIYTWNSVDKQFTFSNTYQNYFLKSLTGSEESIGVSFFSTSRYASSTPSLAGIDRDVKLYDIDEVPIYTASDEGKFLTIMSDGSLAWLLANESFTVESEGGEGGGGAPVTYPEVEDIFESASGWSTYYGASITAEDTVLIGNHHSSMFRTTNRSLDNSIVVDTTVTMWVKTPTYNGTRQLMKWGQWSGNNSKGVQINLGTRTDAAGTHGGNALMANWTDGHIEIKVANDVHNQSAAKGYKIFFRSPVNVTDGQWHQIVVQFSNIGAGLGAGFAKVYVDGVKIDESFANHGLIQQQTDGLQTLRHNPEACKFNGWITIGQGFAGAELDEVTIEEQLLTEEQIVAKFNAGR